MNGRSLISIMSEAPLNFDWGKYVKPCFTYVTLNANLFAAIDDEMLFQFNLEDLFDKNGTCQILIYLN